MVSSGPWLFAAASIVSASCYFSQDVEPYRIWRAQSAMNGPLEWIAAVGTMIAASLIAFDLGRRATAWGFVLFCAVSVTWIVAGLTGDSMPIAAMNFVLLLINAWGVWQYWFHPKNKQPES